ncbi:hypothetical protein Y900_004320 [Mycolicibacterium aromaticivorans JS19b1 = JCM 16368]|uniref:Conserved hypothetical protein CHP02391 domain-containing protein n=1 Tax=Mycolicibacterium aromaticivorans JS19b1 = JCM 16368 TaxID=1440774 RepID=A0A064CER8_9MYCO|nr:TIGR02391 family protein [Mycolicibacterium aromaticivorans]KDE98186.1 hypothetical protein Y900_004320 [Mycolicibacterium aromaticivorans JS19b1 = JCM 16368]
MNDELAHKRLSGVLGTIDDWGDLYDRRWGHADPQGFEAPGLDQQVRDGIDEVRKRTRFARDVIAEMGEKELSANVVESLESYAHPFIQARVAIVEAIAILEQREELAEIIGPVGPRLTASELHGVIWGAAAGLWDDGHYRQAVQTAASALEGLLQVVAGPGLGGENLAKLFTLDSPPTPESPRLRFRDIDPDPTSKTWKSAHEGAASSVRTAFMAVRNLVSHPGWPDPTASEALEMLAVLSFVAHLVDRCDTVTAP